VKINRNFRRKMRSLRKAQLKLLDAGFPFPPQPTPLLPPPIEHPFKKDGSLSETELEWIRKMQTPDIQYKRDIRKKLLQLMEEGEDGSED
jgi:hypothetical protein